MNSYHLTMESVTCVVDGKTYTIHSGDANFVAAREAALNEDWEEFLAYTSKGHVIEKWIKGIEDWMSGRFTYQNGVVRFDGEAIPSEMNQRMLTMAKAGESPEPLMRFWERIQNNPSNRSVTQLYTFLQHAGIPIEPDGYFLAYKAVREDYKDVHSGTVDNHPGQIPTFPRNRISDDPRAACAEGLHVGALQYAQSFGSSSRRILICKIDPADVVSVPYDSNAEKVRVCRYEVIGLYGAKLPDTTFREDDDAPKKAPAQKAVAPQKAQEEPRITAAPTHGDENGSGWEAFHALDKTVLGGLSLSDLRRYARFGLKIVGASKIPGGKEALLGCIAEVRR